MLSPAAQAAARPTDRKEIVMSRKTLSLAVLAAALALTLGSTPGAAGDEHSLVDVLVQSADTPQEHQALADHYRKRAESLRTAAERHRSMGAHYGGNEAMRRAAKRHCDEMAKLDEQLAGQYEELAKLHEGQAGR
jgi:hypothetical protein